MKTFKRLLPFVQPYRWIALLLFFTVVLPVLMELVVPRALSYLIDEGIEKGSMDAVWRGAGLMLLTALLGALATLGQGVFRAWLAQGLAYDLRNRLFAHIQTFSFANLDSMQTGELMTRLSSDVDMVKSFVSHRVSLLLRAFLMMGGSVIMMFVLDWQLALITIVVLPAAGVLIAILMRRTHPLFILVQEKLSSLNTVVQENLAGAQVVKAFVREAHEIGRFDKYNDDFMNENIRVGQLMAVALPALTLLTNLGIVAVLWLGGISVETGRLTVGELVAFNNYLMIGMAPLMLLGNMLTGVSRAEASAERYFEVLDMQPSITVDPIPHEPKQVLGKVTFRDVFFHYEGDLEAGTSDRGNGSSHRGGRNVLNGISFSAEPGERVAFLGATGAGKSTLVNLIPRFYDVDSGIIEVDEVDVRRWNPGALRQKIGVVLQQTTLFSGTVHENIAFGRKDATREQVVAAAEAAQAHDFISAMPEGYDSHIEERGANLSGGQKQRLAIARALLIKPSILILDDSTSSVDLETEARIQSALDTGMKGTTTFMVAQRISSVLDADQIVVLDNGQVHAVGTHDELLKTSPIYQEIYHSQLGNHEGEVLS